MNALQQAGVGQSRAPLSEGSGHSSEALTKRECDVLTWVVRGQTNEEIARALWITPATVRKHLENSYAKLGVRTRTAAALRFVGWVDREVSHDPPARRKRSAIAVLVL
jgi:DNA-binding CsgD family transcriptional regulator